MTDDVKFWFRRSEGDPLVLAGPEETLRLTAPGEPIQTGDGESLPHRDPFRALSEFIERFDSGYIAGFLAYELAHPLHGLDVPPVSPGELPSLFLAYFPRRTATLPPSTNPMRLESFSPVQNQETYSRAIQKIHRRIREGYVYQVNYTQRFEAEAEGTLQSLLDPSRASFPPHLTYVKHGSSEILSLSPERFLRTEGNTIYTEPIKGTRPRGDSEGDDQALKFELIQSEKDHAEHAMIVDLERNDLNRICQPGSVHVPWMMEIRSFPTVHHLVSRVQGELRSDVPPGEIFRQTFPGGSITGAPKHTALRVIDFLENRRRGIYTGTIGYWDLKNDIADWNLAIRTLVKQGNRATWDSGGGIVIDSDPQAEYQESLDKTAILRMFVNPGGTEK